MSAFRLAISFIRIPRLFIHLLLWPLVLGVCVAVVQVGLTVAYVKTSTMTATDIAQQAHNERDAELLLQLVYGSSDPIPPIAVCRWLSAGGTETAPPNCEIAETDVVLRVADPQNYDATEYARLYQGATHRLHLCQHCKGSIEILSGKDGVSTDYYTLRAIGVHLLRGTVNPVALQEILHAFESKDRKYDLLGDVNFHPPGFARPIAYSHFQEVLAMTVNVSLLVVITLWLALKAHRRVLDYFARSDALLPLVAACGKSRFYSALWIVTLFRVVCFLLATVPVTYLMHRRYLRDDVLNQFFSNSSELLLWLLGIVSSLSAMAIIASIGELRHRHTMVSFLYNYLPTIIWMIGSAAWAATLIFPGTFSRLAQMVITVIPIVGTSPIILAPMVRSDSMLLVAHSIFSLFVVALLLRVNSRWFAAHLEEI